MGALRFLMVLTASLTLLCGLWAMARGGVDLAGFALVFGAAHAGCITLYPAVAAIWFGKLNLGAILGGALRGGRYCGRGRSQHRAVSPCGADG